VSPVRRDGEARLGEPGDPERLAEADPRLAPLVDRHGPPRVPADRPLFAVLVEAICHQQLSMQAGRSVAEGVREAVGDPIRPAGVLDADPAALREAGLAEAKAGYVRGLARAFDEGHLDADRLAEGDDEAVRAALTDVRGVGPWTADMALIFALHRPDVLPVGDLGLRDAARRVLGLDETPTPSRLREVASPWRPYRSLAAWYLWTERDRRLRAEGTR